MSQTTPILDLPLIQASQAQKHVTHNEALVALDALVQLVVADLDRTEPPATPAEGDRHIVAAGALGGWTGRDGAIAAFLGGGWVFYAAQTGWRAHVLALGDAVIFDGTDWQGAGQGGGTPADTLGLNATANAVNRLTVAAEATLLTHEGAGHQVKINKAAAGDTNSLLFQTNWSGRAEMGCAGNDDWSIKVSGDGTTWAEAITIDGATGRVDMPSSHGTWTPSLGSNKGGDLAGATGLTVAYAYWWKVGPLVTVHTGFDLSGVPGTDFTQKSTFSIDGLPFMPRDHGGAIDQGAVSGFVYRSIGSAQVSLLSGGVSAGSGGGRAYGFIFYTGHGEARPSDRFHMRATYMADG